MTLPTTALEDSQFINQKEAKEIWGDGTVLNLGCGGGDMTECTCINSRQYITE